MTSERLHSALLYLYPKRFRLEYRDAMVETFREARRDSAPAPFWLSIAEDLCRSVCQEHVRDASPGLKHLARCAVASVLTNAVLIGGIAVGITAWVGPLRAISDDLQIADLSTGWVAARTAFGERTLVPSMTVTLTNISSAPVGTVRLNAIFRRVGETTTWGSASIPAVGSDALPPHTSTTPLILRSPFGYTGTDPLPELLRKKEFVDVRVTVLAKRGSQWQAIGEWPVQRQLLEP